MTSFVYRRQLTVEWGHCDPAGIVFNPCFFELFDASSWTLFEAALGVKQQELAATTASSASRLSMRRRTS